MKKIFISIFVCFTAFIALCSFKIDATLTNEEYNQRLMLYSDGKCVVITPDGRGTGTYDIQGSTIYFTWDNGSTQRGKYFPNGSPNHTARVYVEGVNYDADRRVVSRRRQ